MLKCKRNFDCLSLYDNPQDSYSASSPYYPSRKRICNEFSDNMYISEDAVYFNTENIPIPIIPLTPPLSPKSTSLPSSLRSFSSPTPSPFASNVNSPVNSRNHNNNQNNNNTNNNISNNENLENNRFNVSKDYFSKNQIILNNNNNNSNNNNEVKETNQSNTLLDRLMETKLRENKMKKNLDLIFTPEDIREIVSLAIKERDEELHEEFSIKLTERLIEQQMQFTSYNEEKIATKLRNSQYDYMS